MYRQSLFLPGMRQKALLMALFKTGMSMQLRQFNTSEIPQKPGIKHPAPLLKHL